MSIICVLMICPPSCPVEVIPILNLGMAGKLERGAVAEQAASRYPLPRQRYGRAKSESRFHTETCMQTECSSLGNLSASRSVYMTCAARLYARVVAQLPWISLSAACPRDLALAQIDKRATWVYVNATNLSRFSAESRDMNLGFRGG